MYNVGVLRIVDRLTTSKDHPSRDFWSYSGYTVSGLGFRVLESYAQSPKPWTAKWGMGTRDHYISYSLDSNPLKGGLNRGHIGEYYRGY